MKKSKFIVGQWYSYDNWYIKYLRHDNYGIWIACEDIDPTGFYSSSGGYFGSDNDKHLVSIEDLKHLLPKNHPDLISQFENYEIY